MFQEVICKIPQCPYRSSSGFCLNRLVVINEQGVCQHLTKSNWQQPIEKKYKSNYRPPKEELFLSAAVGDENVQSNLEEKQGLE